MTSNVSHLEFGSGTAVQTSQFFSKLFGWSFHSMDNGQEGWFDTPTCKAGLHGSDPQPGISVYFAVPDIDAAVALVKQLGGTTEDISPEEPTFGRFCNCKDPEGLRFGLHQPPK